MSHEGCQHSHHHHHHGASDRIGVAFLLNFGFAIVEIIGGLWVNSIAILSDALHDLGDSMALGMAWYLEKKSHSKSTNHYSYGFRRLSIASALLTSGILIIGSVVVIYHSIIRLLNPEPANALGMIGFAVLGVVVNGAAFLKLSSGKSLNESALKWHLVEDMMGWIIVLIGAVAMYFAQWPWLDPLMGLGLSLWILTNVIKGLRKTIEVFLQAVPADISLEKIKAALCELNPIQDIHHVHLWTMDGETHIFTAHIVLATDLSSIEASQLKAELKQMLREDFKIKEATLEFEWPLENCTEKNHDEII